MKKLLLAATAVTALFAAGAASAEVSYNVALTSDYVFRGISQSDENVALQGGIDWNKDLFYAGAWASTVDFGTDADYEVDLYAGIKPTAGNFSFDFGVIYYAYPQEDDLNATELKAAVSYPMGAGSVGAAYYTNTDDTFDTYYAEINGAYPINDKFAVSGAFGTYEVADAGSYGTWNLGGSYNITDVFSVDVRYHDTDFKRSDFGLGGSQAYNLTKERVAVTLKAAF
ncbi:TorF family putative porin [Asticcacaulis tiandongensis]|uniref:TorF family putative porin n=1 Tax=Asticcacaulis tiandongensis TaxID=2565365 RepID=UPI00112CC417|nr:TorF family putative porin [Asticcacaulis tiandongensis]